MPKMTSSEVSWVCTDTQSFCFLIWVKKYASTTRNSLCADKWHVPLSLSGGQLLGMMGTMWTEKGICHLKGAVANHFQLIIIIWYLSPVLLNFLFFKKPEMQLLSKNLLIFFKKTILGLTFYIKHYNDQRMHSAWICLVGNWFATQDLFQCWKPGLADGLPSGLRD